MRIPKALALGAALALTIAGHIPQAHAAGDLANPDFDATPTAGQPIPGWTQCFGTSTSLAPGEGLDGGTAVRIVDTTRTAAVGVCSSKVPAEPNATYVVSGALKSTTGSPMMIVRFHDANGTIIDSPSRYWNTAQPLWESVQVQATAPAGTVSMQVLLYSSGYNMGDMLWDRIGIRRVTNNWTSTPLAQPVRNVTAVGGTIVSNHPATGRNYSVLPLVGQESAVAVVDLDSGESRQAPLPGIQGAWGAVATESGDVYIGGWSQGRLLKLDPVTLEVTDLGTPVPANGFLWNLTVAPDGKIWGGTYPAGAIFSYDPATGQSVNHGTMVPGLQYARSIAAGDDGTIYVGLGQTNPTVVAFNPSTGEKRVLPLPEPYASEPGMAYDLDYRAGHLFVRVNTSSTLLVTRDMTTWKPIGKGAGLRVSPADAKGKYVYFTDMDSRHLMAYDLREGTVTDTGVSVPGSNRSFGWVMPTTSEKRKKKEAELATTLFDGSTWLFNPHTGATRVVKADVPGVPLVLSTIGEGPDGRIYASGMQSGGLSAVDPATGKVEQYATGVAQGEHLVTVGDKLFIGTYTGAKLHVFDPKQPFAMGTNPRQYASLQEVGQDRPHATAVNGTTLAVGSVPDYGRHDGGVALVDTTTLTHTFVKPVADQSVLALEPLGDGFIGGTGVYGGLGAAPKAQDGELFILDGQGKVTWHGVPLPGERAITALRTAPDGTIWGVTAGKLFQFDPKTKQVLRVTTLQPFNWASVGSLWASGSIEFLGDGRAIVVARGFVHEVDVATFSSHVIASDAKVLIKTRAGELFYANQDKLVRLQEKPA